MFKSIRRNSKQLLESTRRKNSNQVSSLSSDQTLPPTSNTSGNITFFSLPAELRNVIYEHIATETEIMVPIPSTKKSPKNRPPIPSLLLVSPQTRQEYLPILLQHSPITFQILAWDFSNTLRIIRSLYSTELKSLRRNPSLTLQLHLEKLTQSSLAALRRWLVDRSSHLDRLHFAYAVAWPKHSQIIPTSTQVQAVNIYMNRRMVLEQCLEALSQLHWNVEEAVRFELQPIVRVLEEEQVAVGRNTDLPWRDDGGMGLFGIPIRRSYA